MKAIIPWALGAMLTFAIVSSAFLLLANLGTEPGEIVLEPREEIPGADSSLELRLDEEQLDSLRSANAQEIGVQVRNRGSKTFPDVNLLVEVYSEDTASPGAEIHRKALTDLDSGDTAEVSFSVDLSSNGESEDSYPGSESPRKIVEIRATTPDGASDARTVILPVLEG